MSFKNLSIANKILLLIGGSFLMASLVLGFFLGNDFNELKTHNTNIVSEHLLDLEKQKIKNAVQPVAIFLSTIIKVIPYLSLQLQNCMVLTDETCRILMINIL